MKRVFLSGIMSTLFLCIVTFLYALTPSTAWSRNCAAIIYEHANYKGAAQCLQEGSYNVGDLEIGNDQLSSLRVRDGNTVILFEHKNFSGRKASVSKNTPFVGERWNDIVSSIIVE